MSSSQASSQTTTSKESKGSRSHDSKVDCALAISETLLSAFKEIARACPVPYLKDAAGLMCTVIEMIDDTRSNSFGYSDVIQDIAVHTHDAIQAMMTMKEDDTTYINLQRVIGQMTDIRVICETANKRNAVTKFLMSKRDGKKLEDVRRQFASNMTRFQFQSTLQLLQAARKNGDTEAAKKELEHILEKSRLAQAQSNPGFQRYIGRTAFGGDVFTINDVQSPSQYTPQPMQVFSGDTVFLGKVITENKIRVH